MLAYLGIDAPRLIEEGALEVNFMARGIFHATMVTTVSPTYAHEILTPAYGERLDSLLRYRHFDVHGILNGLDYDVWNPATDPHIASAFSADRLEERAANKRALQQRLGLPESDAPLVAMVTRLDAQKGLDIAGHVAHLLLNAASGDAQLVVLGSGAAEYEDMFRHLAGYHREKMAAVLRYDAALAPLVYAGSDMFLMPSRFEPCGLGQMIAMRYGSVPVVRATGGLVDTVREDESGFLFAEYTGRSVLGRPQPCTRDVPHRPGRRGRPCSAAAWRRISRGRRQRGVTSRCSIGPMRGSEAGEIFTGGNQEKHL